MNKKHILMEIAFIRMAQNDGVNRNNEALIPAFSTLGTSISSIQSFPLIHGGHVPRPPLDA